MADRDINIRVKVKDDGSVVLEHIGGRGRKAFDGIDKSSRKARREIGFFNRSVLDTAKGFGLATVAMDAGRAGLRGIRDEITLGLRVVEEYNLTTASMTAFMTTFSQRAKDGDIAGAFKEAHKYSQALIPALEVMDAKTIATGKDLATITETMMMHGVVLDVNNRKQETGFLNIVNALKLITAGQNQDIQMRQEINALMAGQIRMTDRLPKLLAAIDPQIQEHLKLWKAEGTLIEKVGGLLDGFGESTELIEKTWSAIGSSLQTIHDRILRDAFKPVYGDLISLAIKLRDKYIDQNGELTESAKIIQQKIKTEWRDFKFLVGDTVAVLQTVYDVLSTLVDPVLELTKGWREMRSDYADFERAVWNLWDVMAGKKHWATGERILTELEKRYENIAKYSKAAAAHHLIVQGNTELAKPFFDGLDIAGEMGLKGEGGAPKPERAIKLLQNEEKIFALDFAKEQARDQLRADAQKANEKQQKQNAQYAKEIQKAWEDVTLAALPEHEQAVARIKDEYGEWHAVVEQLYVSGEKGQAWADLMHEQLGVRMTEDIEKLKDETGGLSEFWVQAFRNMEQAGSDLFFGVMQGNLDDFGHRFKDMVDRMVSDWLSAQMLMGLFGEDYGKGGELGGLLGTLFSGTVNSYDSGGWVDEPVFGIGKHSGQPYTFAERNPELVVNPRNIGVAPQAAGGGNNAFYVQIVAVDSKSFEELVRSNPQAVGMTVIDLLQSGDSALISTLNQVRS